MLFPPDLVAVLLTCDIVAWCKVFSDYKHVGNRTWDTSVSAAGDATADGDTTNGSGNGASSSLAYRYPPKVSLKLNFDTSAPSWVESLDKQG